MIFASSNNLQKEEDEKNQHDTLKNRDYNYRMKMNARDQSFDDNYSN
jgi:hypothetical protein